MAKSLSITKRARKKWSEEEIQNLIDVYPSVPNYNLVSIFGRREQAIKRKAHEFGLYKEEPYQYRSSYKELTDQEDKVSLQYIAGYFDGEGCIQLRVGKQRDNLGIGINANPSISLMTNDVAIIRSIAATLKSHGLKFSYNQRPRHKNGVRAYLSIARKEEIIKFADLFLPLLHSSKKLQLTMLINEAMPLLNHKGREKYSPRFILLMAALRDVVNAHKGQVGSKPLTDTYTSPSLQARFDDCIPIKIKIPLGNLDNLHKRLLWAKYQAMKEVYLNEVGRDGNSTIHRDAGKETELNSDQAG